jgi:hypothetical protein
MMIGLDTIQRIALALRSSLPPGELLTDQVIADRDFFMERYREFKGKHSFSWSGRVAEIATIHHILGMEFDASVMEPDKGF